MNHLKSINIVQRLQTYNLLQTKSMLQSKSTNTLQYKHLTNVLLEPGGLQEQAKGGWREPTELQKLLEPVMCKVADANSK